MAVHFHLIHLHTGVWEEGRCQGWVGSNSPNTPSPHSYGFVTPPAVLKSQLCHQLCGLGLITRLSLHPIICKMKVGQ